MFNLTFTFTPPVGPPQSFPDTTAKPRRRKRSEATPAF